MVPEAPCSTLGGGRTPIFGSEEAGEFINLLICSILSFYILILVCFLLSCFWSPCTSGPGPPNSSTVLKLVIVYNQMNGPIGIEIESNVPWGKLHLGNYETHGLCNLIALIFVSVSITLVFSCFVYLLFSIKQVKSTNERL